LLSGVGFGICCRFIEQLSYKNPPDIQLGPSPSKSSAVSPYAGSTRLTLILACRSEARAMEARRLLLKVADETVEERKRTVAYDGHAEKLREGLTIDFIPLDLASVESVFRFGEHASLRYPYISHLILNAGLLNMIGIDFYKAFHQFIRNPALAVTIPNYFVQDGWSESEDNLGFLWQCNVFGHFCLYRELEQLLFRNPQGDSRIEWSSSLDAYPDAYDHSDVQLRNGKLPYQASKYQVDMISAVFAQQERKAKPRSSEASIYHVTTHPGVCHTNNTAAGLVSFLVWAKILSFFLGRLFGSQNHPIYPKKGALSAVYTALAPVEELEDSTGILPQKYGTRSTMHGVEYVGFDPVEDWQNHQKNATELVAYCDRLRDTFTKARA